MSLFCEQITGLIQDKLEYENQSLGVQIRFDENFIGFDGHFPGKPVLPGVIMIKVMIRMYELYKKKEYRLSQIKKAKFIEPILAGMAASFFISANEKKDESALQGKIIKEEKIIAKISLILQETSAR
jgi:3-hydroxymyristoyl/3-hydroxydecanoyl-(acyl carrier protein) dehydratase